VLLKLRLTKCAKDDQQAALEALPTHIKYLETEETETEFIPHAATWLNSRPLGRMSLICKKTPPGNVPWYSDEQLTMAKAREVGVIHCQVKALASCVNVLQKKLGRLSSKPTWSEEYRHHM